ncbi:MAG: hypothetical protein MJ072_02485, partial [Clostridia bacterium]|nr:hypothetical protein [Clostridia bacterium]
AVKDIRASVGTSNFSMSWGNSNNTFVCVYDNDQVSCPIKTPGDSTIADGDDSIFFYQLYVSYSDSVGDPILANSLSIVKSLSDVPDGYEYARWFSGGAFDFCVQAENGDFGTQRILCYAPEQAFRYYSDSEDYLAGISFFSGSTAWLGDSEYNLQNWAKSYGYKVFGPDITAGSMHDGSDKTFMAYATTKNPKKAITDIGVFTGEAQGDGMLLDNVCRNGVFFQSSAVFSVGDKGYSDNGKVKERFVRNSHAYITKVSMEANMCDMSGWSNYAIKPRGMFLAGPTEGVDAIKLKDVLYSYSANDIPVLRGKNNNIYSLLTESPLNKAAGSGYKTVHALDKYFYDTYDNNGNLKAVGTNIGVSRNETTGADCCFYLFFKNGTENIVKGKYIASLEIVGSVAETAYDDARYQAMGAGQEIVNLSAPLYTSPNARYDVSNESVVYNKNDLNKYAESCVFLVASYQETTSHAIGGALIAYQDGTKELPSSISRVADYSNKSYTYYKGRYVSPVGYKLGETPEENSGNFAKGYVIYTTQQGDALGRVGVMENGQTGVELGTYFTYLTNEKGELFSANGGFEQAIALYSADTAQYISAITISKEGYFPSAQFELNQMGYRQFIVSDILAGNVMSRYHIGIA